MASTNTQWGMVIDVDKCIGCQGCVVACQSENNIPINTEDLFNQRRAIEWIRVERYWEGEFPDVKARFIPILCQHCNDAPCEPVCPVFATYHNNEGMNVQVYNRCIGTRVLRQQLPVPRPVLQLLGAGVAGDSDEPAQPRRDGPQPRDHGEVHVLHPAHSPHESRGCAGRRGTVRMIRAS